MQIIDIHCHILPEMDDGAKSMEMAEKMLSMAYGQGVGALIATPHHSRYFPTEAERIRSMCRDVEQKICKLLGAKMRIYPGQELLYRDSLLQELEDGKLLTLADSRYVLVEFMPETTYSVIYSAARRFALSGYRMVVAHVERCEAFRDEEHLEELGQIGVYFQINVHSLTGKWYNSTARWCRKMLKEKWIHFIASDMHNEDSRKPCFDMVQQWMEKHLEQEYIEDISWRNAWKLINDQKI